MEGKLQHWNAELEWGFHGLRTGVSSAVGDDPEETMHIRVGVTQLVMWMGHQAYSENVGETNLTAHQMLGLNCVFQNSHGEALYSQTQN